MGLSQAQSEDVAQEAFLRAWKNLNRFDPRRAQFSTWLFAIARNLALTELVRPHRAFEVTMPEDLPDSESGDAPQIDALIVRQQRQALLAALRSLSHDDRSVLALVYVNELDLAAIARIEHCSLAAVKTRLHRARRKLYDLLKDQ